MNKFEQQILEYLTRPGYKPVKSDKLIEVFPGTPEFKDGMIWVNDAPGLGIDLNEKLAAKYPITDDPPFDMFWGRLRDADGTIRRP